MGHVDRQHGAVAQLEVVARVAVVVPQEATRRDPVRDPDAHVAPLAVKHHDRAGLVQRPGQVVATGLADDEGVVAERRTLADRERVGLAVEQDSSVADLHLEGVDLGCDGTDPGHIRPGGHEARLDVDALLVELEQVELPDRLQVIAQAVDAHQVRITGGCSGRKRRQQQERQGRGRGCADGGPRDRDDRGDGDHRGDRDADLDLFLVLVRPLLDLLLELFPVDLEWVAVGPVRAAGRRRRGGRRGCRRRRRRRRSRRCRWVGRLRAQLSARVHVRHHDHALRSSDRLVVTLGAHRLPRVATLRDRELVVVAHDVHGPHGVVPRVREVLDVLVELLGRARLRGRADVAELHFDEVDRRRRVRSVIEHEIEPARLRSPAAVGAERLHLPLDVGGDPAGHARGRVHARDESSLRDRLSLVGLAALALTQLVGRAELQGASLCGAVAEEAAHVAQVFRDARVRSGAGLHADVVGGDTGPTLGQGSGQRERCSRAGHGREIGVGRWRERRVGPAELSEGHDQCERESDDGDCHQRCVDSFATVHDRPPRDVVHCPPNLDVWRARKLTVAVVRVQG